VEAKPAACTSQGIAGFVQTVTGGSSNPNSDFLHSINLKNLNYRRF
jgi:hypothetical protein